MRRSCCAAAVAASLLCASALRPSSRSRTLLRRGGAQQYQQWPAQQQPQQLATRCPEPVPVCAAEERTLPRSPSVGLILVLWSNTLALGLGVLLLVAALRFAFARVRGLSSFLGAEFEVSTSALRLGLLWCLPCLAFSVAPLEKWFPKRLGFLKAIGDHTEALTALAFGSEFGRTRRWLTVFLGTAVLSATAGFVEELAFRGTLQNGLQWCLEREWLLGSLPDDNFKKFLPSALAIVGASAVFGKVHDYCGGYACVAAFVGAFFGVCFALTQNLFVPALAHALMDFVAFNACYVAVARADDTRKRHLANLDFPLTRVLHNTRRSLFDGRPQRPSPKKVTSSERPLPHRPPLPAVVLGREEEVLGGGRDVDDALLKSLPVVPPPPPPTPPPERSVDGESAAETFVVVDDDDHAPQEQQQQSPAAAAARI